MASPQRPKLKVAICGGGIAGLTGAAFLAKSPDIELHVYEGKSEIQTIGAGIAIWKRYWDVLEEAIDLESECSARGLQLLPWSEVKGPVLRKADNPSHCVDFSNLPHGPRILPRDVLLDILHKHSNNNSSCSTHTNKKVISWDQHGPTEITVSFQDGSSTNVDLLIGADGVHSCVRQHLFSENSVFREPEFSGQLAYRMSCLRADIERLKPDNGALRGFRIWCGNGRHVTSNTDRELIYITAYDNVFDAKGLPLPFDGPWVTQVPPAEIAERFAGWESDLVSLLGAPKVASRWAIHVVHPLPTFVADRVCLIGDAAHAMTPHQGLGGGQGIEDAYILARLIAHPQATATNLPDVLRIYDSIRRPFSQEVARRSFTVGLIYGFLDPNSREVPLKQTGEEFIASCRWLLEGDGVEKEWMNAQSALATLPSCIAKS